MAITGSSLLLRTRNVHDGFIGTNWRALKMRSCKQQGLHFLGLGELANPVGGTRVGISRATAREVSGHQVDSKLNPFQHEKKSRSLTMIHGI